MQVVYQSIGSVGYNLVFSLLDNKEIATYSAYSLASGPDGQQLYYPKYVS